MVFKKKELIIYGLWVFLWHLLTLCLGRTSLNFKEVNTYKMPKTVFDTQQAFNNYEYPYCCYSHDIEAIPLSFGSAAENMAMKPFPAVLASEIICTIILLPLDTRAPGRNVPQKRPIRWPLLWPLYTSTKSQRHRLSLSRSMNRKLRTTTFPLGTCQEKGQL